MWKILIVDDNFTDRRLLQEVLKGRAECELAANAREAIDAYKHSIRERRLYDAILLDVDMPDESGLVALGKIRETEKNAGILLENGIPVFMVTAHQKPCVQAFGKGCDDYIVKPISAAALIKRLEERLGR